MPLVCLTCKSVDLFPQDDIYGGWQILHVSRIRIYLRQGHGADTVDWTAVSTSRSWRQVGIPIMQMLLLIVDILLQK